MLLNENVCGQSTGIEIRSANVNRKIAVDALLGNWTAIDYPESKISFVNVNNFIVSLEGIQHGIGGYSFMMEQDSISVNGTAPNWPPYNCTLTLIAANELKIDFYQYFTKEATSVVYRR
jgi:hypothetical protein